MSELAVTIRGRRRLALRRLFFCLCLAFVPASMASGQQQTMERGDGATRILERRVRITRDRAGHLRLIESLSVRVGEDGGASTRGGPLRLVRLSSASEVRALGGDVGPRQVAFEAPDLVVIDSLGPGELQVVFTYVVRKDVGTYEFAAALPVDEFVVEIQRGSVSARPDPRFELEGGGGPARRPFRRYVASRIPAGHALDIDFTRSRVGAHQRLAVLMGTAAAMGGVMIWVWRRDTTAADESLGRTRPRWHRP